MKYKPKKKGGKEDKQCQLKGKGFIQNAYNSGCKPLTRFVNEFHCMM